VQGTVCSAPHEHNADLKGLKLNWFSGNRERSQNRVAMAGRIS
jgi:hypothetical protein